MLPRVVVFDVAGVLIPSGGSIGPVTAEFAVPRTEVSAAYWSCRDAYDRGGSPRRFWTQVAARLGRTLDAGRLARLVAVDGAPWSALSADVTGLLADVARRGVPLAILSNAPAPLAAVVRGAPWSAAFGNLLFSSDVGALKPEPAIYAELERRLGCEGAEIAFFDDRQANVDAATGRGWLAARWTGLAGARQAIRHGGLE